MLRNTFTFILTSLLSVCFLSAFAQDDLFAELEKEAPKTKDYAFATFKSTRLINGSTIECVGAGVLDFRISHRFAAISQGMENFWGIDNAYTKLSLDYGITKWLMIGIGHSAFNKEDDGSIKIKILRQQNNGGIPFTLTYFAGMSIETMAAPPLPDSTYKWLFSNRLYYAHQLLIGRKFNDKFSLQIMPSVVHYNLVDDSKFSNNTFALGIGGRMKITKRSAITAEYFFRLNNTNLLVMGQQTYDGFSIGYELETGGHVFQMMLSNSQGITERTFIGETTDSWSKNQIHIGFNVSRVFTIIEPKGYKEGHKVGTNEEAKEEPIIEPKKETRAEPKKEKIKEPKKEKVVEPKKVKEEEPKEEPKKKKKKYNKDKDLW